MFCTPKMIKVVAMPNLSVSQELFSQEINKPASDLDLGKAALYIALEEYPALNVQDYLNTLDAMASEIHVPSGFEDHPLSIIQAINQYLFEQLGYRGSTLHHYNPVHHHLNEVLDRCSGISLSLSIVYLEMAKRIQFPMVGIGLPGHFLIRPVAEPNLFVDPFHQGAILTQETCQWRLMEIFQRPVPLKPEYFKPFTPHEILLRLLNNLKMAYLHHDNLPKALLATEFMLLLNPNDIQSIRDRGILNYQLDHLQRARPDLEQYLSLESTASDKNLIQAMLSRIPI